MARVCDFNGCECDAVATVEHPAAGQADVCETDMQLFGDDAVIERHDEDADTPKGVTDFA